MQNQIIIDLLPYFKRKSYLKLEEEIYLVKEEDNQGIRGIRAQDKNGCVLGFARFACGDCYIKDYDYERLYDLLGNEAAAAILSINQSRIICEVTQYEVFHRTSKFFVVKSNAKIFPTNPFEDFEKLHLFKSENPITLEKRIDLIHQTYGNCGYIPHSFNDDMVDFDKLFDMVDIYTKFDLHANINGGVVFEMLKNKKDVDQPSFYFILDAYDDYTGSRSVKVGEKLLLSVEKDDYDFSGPSILAFHQGDEIGEVMTNYITPNYANEFELFENLNEVDFALIEHIDQDYIYCKLMNFEQYEKDEYEILSKTIKLNEEVDMNNYFDKKTEEINHFLSPDNMNLVDGIEPTSENLGVTQGKFIIDDDEELAEYIKSFTAKYIDEDDEEELEEDYDEELADDEEDYLNEEEIEIIQTKAKEKLYKIAEKYNIDLEQDLPLYKLKNSLNSKLAKIGYCLA